MQIAPAAALALSFPGRARRRLVEEFPLKNLAFGLIALLLFCSCRQSDEEPGPLRRQIKQARPAAGHSVVSGHVFFTGVAPAPRVFSAIKDNACGAAFGEQKTSEEVVVAGDGSLKNAFVHVSKGLEGLAYEAPSTSAVLDQIGCRFVPHVLGLQTGQTLRIVNSDKTLHNVHARTRVNKAFNLGLTVKTPEAQRIFEAPEVMIPIRCNVHPWMESYIGVVDHPYYGVTGGGGSYSLRGLPSGEYTIEAWHEKFGSLSKNFTIGDTDSIVIDFTFSH